MKDYSTSRFFAISGIGYGKGDSAQEALDNYVATQLRNHPASTTVFKTKAKWEEALRSGQAAPGLWYAPEGTTGFVMDHRGLNWTDADGTYTAAGQEEQVYV